MRSGYTAWRKVKLGDLFDLKYGFALPEKKRLDGRCPVYASSGKVGYNDKPAVNSEGIVLGRKGNVGSVFYSERPFFPIDTVYFIDSLKFEGDLKFIYYLLKRIPFQKVGSDVGVPGLNRDLAYSLEAVIPESKTEQQRIASILSSFDSKIENNNQVIRILEEMAQAIFKEWFVKFRFPGHEKVEFVESELGRIPKGWEVGTLFDTAEVTYGYPFKSKLFNENHSGQPVVRIRNLADGNSSTYTTEQVDNKYSITPGDILIGMDGEFYVRRWIQEKALLNQRVARIVPMKGFSWNFLFMYLSKEIRKKQLEVSGSTVAHLGDSDLKRLKVLLPPKELRVTFKELDCMYRLLIRKSKENKILSQTRDLLLPKLMSGKLLID